MVDNKTSNKIEDLINIKKILEDKDDDIKKNLLNHLKAMEVSYNELAAANIAKSVLKLSKHNDKEISSLANEVVNLWKKKCKKPVDDDKVKTNGTSQKKEIANQIQSNTSINKNNMENKQKLDTVNIKTNSKSLYEKFKESLKEVNDPKRNNFRQLFFDTFCKKEKMSKEDENSLKEESLTLAKKLSIEIEENIYSLLYSQSDKGSKYINKGKSIYLNLTMKNNELRENVLNGSITPQNLAKMDVKEMASQQLKIQRQQTVDEDFNSRRSDWNKLHSTVENGIYKCKMCKGSRTSKFQLQMRSADEPMTTFINCIDCGHQWKHN